jgi:hypothetical protein
VLNAIPIFYLSFLKIPVQVWKIIKRIQREFLWGCRGGRKRVNWVKWDDVCKPKHLGGLGVRDLRVVNISLLAKWRWRLISGGNALWIDVIKSKYGEQVIGKLEWEDRYKPWFSSLWWKDLSSIGSNLDTNWFGRSVKRNLGNGASTSFWLDTWVGNSPLKDRFPRLFSISNQKEALVADLWGGSGAGRWNFSWRRAPFAWEEPLLEEFMAAIQSIGLSDHQDYWSWVLEPNGIFSVKSTYAIVSDVLSVRGGCSSDQSFAFRSVWKCPAPSKVQGFAWLFLLDRIPSKVN